jgi:hypothetical protein
MKVSWNPAQPLKGIARAAEPKAGELGVYLLFSDDGIVYAGSGELLTALRRHAQPDTADDPQLRAYLEARHRQITYSYFVEQNDARRLGAEAFILLLRERLGLLNNNEASADPIYVNPPQPEVFGRRVSSNGTWKSLFRDD